jgi:hypothetical protein
VAVKGELKFEEFVVQYKKEIELELLALATQLTGVIQKHAPVGGNNHLSGSFEGRQVEVPGGIGVEVGSPLEYGPYVEWGTKPHWAPIQPLIEWVEQKIQPHVLAVGINFDSGRALPNKSRKNSIILKGDARKRAVLSLAHAIQCKIAAKGTQGQFYMRDSLIEMGIGFTFNEKECMYYVDVAGWLGPKMPEIIGRATGKLA